MKAILIVILSFTTWYPTFADTRNANQGEIQWVQQSLQNPRELMEMSSQENSGEQFSVLKSYYLKAKQAYNHLSTNFPKTKELLELLLIWPIIWSITSRPTMYFKKPISWAVRKMTQAIRQ